MCQPIFQQSTELQHISWLHQKDDLTRWFGVRSDEHNNMWLEDHGRFDALMDAMAENSGRHVTRCPQLVGFMGPTNGGKSTLVKLLIESSKKTDQTYEDASPVVGSAAYDCIPTSGDVHLYADPASITSERPLLIADCEGFDGGERLPLGVQICQEQGPLPTAVPPDLLSSRRRPLQWADTPEHRRREFIVSKLYPRITYAFADCVVFVLRNPKSFASTALDRLLDCAAATFDRSSTVKPHCIIALNATSTSVDASQWDVDSAKRELLSPLSDCLHPCRGVPKLRALAEHWRSLRYEIHTVEHLILRYYDSFSVVRIPTAPNYHKIKEQGLKLRHLIEEGCQRSASNKRKSRMLASAEEFRMYILHGFDHFANTLETAFDFFRHSLSHQPISKEFGRHAFQLYVMLGECRVRSMFPLARALVASCILMDCLRFRKGAVLELFKYYGRELTKALHDYVRRQAPGTHRVDHEGRSERHSGALDVTTEDEIAREIIGQSVEEYVETFKPEVSKLHLEIMANGSSTVSTADQEKTVRLELHADRLHRVYEECGSDIEAYGRATCVCCLMKKPEHPLPCGHILCDDCVRDYGTVDDDIVQIQSCPLHHKKVHWSPPAVVSRPSAGAGLRVLCLENGGIRGVLQLEILAAIDSQLGEHFTIWDCLDLTVGSGTGGLIAAAMSRPNATFEGCFETLRDICDAACTSGKGLPLRVIDRVARSSAAHRASPLDSVLREIFTEKNFGAYGYFRTNARVAVVVPDAPAGTAPLSSYHRPSIEQGMGPNMRSWEVIRATLAGSLEGGLSTGGDAFTGRPEKSLHPAVAAFEEACRSHPKGKSPALLFCLGTGRDAHKKSLSFAGSEHWTRLKEAHERMGGASVRVDVDLDNLPKSNQHKQMDDLRNQVQKVFGQPHFPILFNSIAVQLVATEFIFRASPQSSVGAPHQAVSGTISCRRQSNSDGLQRLLGILKDRCDAGFPPRFVARCGPGLAQMEQIKILELSEILQMEAYRAFTAIEVSLPAAALVSIRFKLFEDEPLCPEGYPISGLPLRDGKPPSAIRQSWSSTSDGTRSTSITDASSLASAGESPRGRPNARSSMTRHLARRDGLHRGATPAMRSWRSSLSKTDIHSATALSGGRPDSILECAGDKVLSSVSTGSFSSSSSVRTAAAETPVRRVGSPSAGTRGMGTTTPNASAHELGPFVPDEVDGKTYNFGATVKADVVAEEGDGKSVIEFFGDWAEN